MRTRTDPASLRAMATSTSTGAPSNDPCAASVPLGADGKPRILIAADSTPLGEPRTETVDVNFASPAREVVGPFIEPDALSVPASAGDQALRSDAARFQRMRRAGALWLPESGA